MIPILRTVAVLLLLASTLLSAQKLPHTTGSIHTAEVDLGFETFGKQGSAIPVIAVNGGPGLSHAYMLQNDVWQAHRRHAPRHLLRPTRHRSLEAPLPRGPRRPCPRRSPISKPLREHFHLARAAFVGDSFGGLIVTAYAAAHPEHVASLILSDAASPSIKGIVHPPATNLP